MASKYHTPISAHSMTQEARIMLYENIEHSITCQTEGADPLDNLLELEQLAMELGFSDVHEYIIYLKQT